MLLVAGFMFYLIMSEKNPRKITVPPPSTPSFFQQAGPPAELQEMTVFDYDLSELKKFVTGILLPLAIVSFIHFKFDIAQPLFVQTFMAPFTLYECALFRVLVLRISEQRDPSLKRPFVVKNENPFAALMGQEPEAQAPVEEEKEKEKEDNKEKKDKSKKKKNKSKQTSTKENDNSKESKKEK